MSHTIRVAVTATNGGSGSATASHTGVVTAPAPPTPPSNTAPPSISGQTVQGQTLTADKGSWSGTAPISYAYQWQGCSPGCSNISGATGQTYTLQGSDVGDTVDVVVTASNSTSAIATSSQTVPVTASGGGGGGEGGTVPCALTHAAGADGTNSCWATHTGVQGATGFTEAQIKAGATGFTHVSGDVHITQPNTVIDHEWISGCVDVASAATNVTIKDSLITPNGDLCKGGDNVAAASLINNGNQTGGNGLLIEDTTVDGGNVVTSSGNGISVHDARLVRVNAFGISKNYVLPFNDTLTDSYSHDAAHTNTGDHNDPVFINSGSHVTVSTTTSSVRAAHTVRAAASQKRLPFRPTTDPTATSLWTARTWRV